MVSVEWLRIVVDSNWLDSLVTIVLSTAIVVVVVVVVVMFDV